MNAITTVPSEAAIAANAALIEVRLTAIRYAARDTNLFEVQRPDRGPLPAAEPGAHIDIHLPNGLVRQYSLTVPDPAPTSYVLGVKRDPNSRGGSRYMFDELHVGRRLKISAPRNNFPLAEDAAHTILLAGGIGITPIWAMAQRLQSRCRSWTLFYSCRSRADAAFLEALQDLAPVRLHFDDEEAGQILDLEDIVAAASKDAHLYCCGPLPMLGAFEEATKQWPADQVHVEYFTAKETPNREGGFVVQLARAGREFVIPPGKSILEVLRDAGLPVVYSCEGGICGTCETVVLSGAPDHRDSVLTDKERAAGKTMMICCSGAKSGRLVLDL